MTTEFKVGIVVLLGIVILFYMSFRVGKFGSLTEGRGYTVTVHFKNIAGLDTKSPVEIAGVEVGRVNKITLDGSVAKAALLMKERREDPRGQQGRYKILRHPRRQVYRDHARANRPKRRPTKRS